MAAAANRRNRQKPARRLGLSSALPKGELFL
jgi:hypothetical protein